MKVPVCVFARMCVCASRLRGSLCFCCVQVGLSACVCICGAMRLDSDPTAGNRNGDPENSRDAHPPARTAHTRTPIGRSRVSNLVTENNFSTKSFTSSQHQRSPFHTEPGHQIKELEIDIYRRISYITVLMQDFFSRYKLSML